MATAVHNALKRKKELERELGEINRFLALYDQFSDANPSTRTKLAAIGGKESVESDLHKSGSGDVEKMRGRPAEFAGLMEQAIRAHNRPLSRTELVAILEASDVDIPSEDKPRYLGTILWRHKDKFVNVSGKGYLMEDMLPPDQAAKERRMSDMLSEDDDVASADRGTL